MTPRPTAPIDVHDTASAVSNTSSGQESDPSPATRRVRVLELLGIVRARHALPVEMRPDSDPVPPSSRALGARPLAHTSGPRGDSRAPVVAGERTGKTRVRLDPIRTAGGGSEFALLESARRGT